MKKSLGNFLPPATLLLLVLLLFLYLLLTFTSKEEAVSKSTTPEFKIAVDGISGEWSEKFLNNSGYELPFLKISKLNFAKDNDWLFVRYQLAGLLPKDNESLPKVGHDKVRSVAFYMNIDENYYDSSGNLNPGGDDALLKISFYGTEIENKPQGKISIDGYLVEGGPGYDYFTIKFPYYQVFQNAHDKVVISTYSYLSSKYMTAGAASYNFRNSDLMPKESANKLVIKWFDD